MTANFSQRPDTILNEGRLGLFTQFPFLPVHFHRTTTACLEKDREELLAFYAFPAAHWQSLRTTNPIESTFGTIRHRTTRTKGCLTREGLLHMRFKLGRCTEKTWRSLRGFKELDKVIKDIRFIDGIEETRLDPVAA